jgi:hypothetical protein
MKKGRKSWPEQDQNRLNWVAKPLSKNQTGKCLSRIAMCVGPGLIAMSGASLQQMIL